MLFMLVFLYEACKGASVDREDLTGKENETVESPPIPKDFKIPADEEEFEQMIDGMMKCGCRGKHQVKENSLHQGP